MIFALRRELGVFVSGLGIFENFSFVIADHDFLVVVIQDVAGIDRDFAAATRALFLNVHKIRVDSDNKR